MLGPGPRMAGGLDLGRSAGRPGRAPSPIVSVPYKPTSFPPNTPPNSASQERHGPFDPRELMTFPGLVPSEDSVGARERRGSWWTSSGPPVRRPSPRSTPGRMGEARREVIPILRPGGLAPAAGAIGESSPVLCDPRGAARRLRITSVVRPSALRACAPPLGAPRARRTRTSRGSAVIDNA